ncbi:hypothetical protein ATK36_0022 [Amycolatopsis sulphurea]|uniref:Uncharacterized protein n=1 Tax=Amycolatopsis sulphurea TaxID=76022 RepID=A0A2A9FYG1_9PSEU|nr:hypothetical protein ATK36_0022 [Amycolatopsis sulphurea]
MKGPFTDSESVKGPFTDLHTDFADTLAPCPAGGAGTPAVPLPGAGRSGR